MRDPGLSDADLFSIFMRTHSCEASILQSVPGSAGTVFSSVALYSPSRMEPALQVFAEALCQRQKWS